MPSQAADTSLKVLAVEGDGRLAGLGDVLGPALAVTAVGSPSAAIAALTQGVPDVVFLDLALAGAATAEWMARLHAAAPTVPLIVLAAPAAAAAALAAVEAGGDGFLICPGEEAGRNALADIMRQSIRRAAAGHCRERGGEGGPLRLDLSFLRDATGRAAATMAVAEAPERRRNGERLRLAAKVFESSTEGILVTDAHEIIVRVNPAFTELTGYTPEEVIGRKPSVLQSGRHDRAFYEGMHAALKSAGRWQGEIWNRRKDGQVFVEWLNIGSVRDARGEITHYVAVFSDITARKQNEERLSHQLNHDPLTSLPNRILLQERLRHALTRARRHKLPVAVLFVDLDQFKEVNDRHGHFVGDLLLQEVGARLVASTRQGDTVARLAGDEFIVLLDEIADLDDAAGVAQKILRRMNAPFDLDGRNIGITASIGISHYPGDGEDVDGLITAADMAMYRAKKQGKNSYCFYSERVDKQAFERLALLDGMVHALERGEFRLLFQPIYHVASGRIVLGEALLRWHHPRAGVVVPGQFLPLAATSGIMVPLGAWALGEACRHLRAWRDAGHTDVGVSVNVAAEQLAGAGFVRVATDALQARALPPESLYLEVSEKAAMGRDFRPVLTDLKQAGVHLALDDFGTGASSFAQMRRLPFDVLKIDRSLMADIAADADDARIITAITAIAHSMRMRVVVQGVESREQLAFLRGCGCDLVQGLLLGAPVAPEDFAAALETAASLPT